MSGSGSISTRLVKGSAYTGFKAGDRVKVIKVEVNPAGWNKPDMDAIERIGQEGNVIYVYEGEDFDAEHPVEVRFDVPDSDGDHTLCFRADELEAAA